MVAKNGSSILLTALESSSDNDSEGSDAEEDYTSSDDELAEVSGVNTAQASHSFPEHMYSNPYEFCEHRVAVDSERAESV